MSSILTGIAQSSMFVDEATLEEAMCDISKQYSFVDMLYTLDDKGIQTSRNVYCRQKRYYSANSEKSCLLSYLNGNQFPWFSFSNFLLAQEIV